MYATPNSNAPMNVAVIATPPPSGFTFACTFRPPGLSTKLSLGASQIMKRVSTSE